MPTLKTQKLLWGKAAGKCSYPDCKIPLFHDESETDDPTHVGENCHIVAESDDGPRGIPEMPVDKRNLYGNLILLCRNHHKIIDAQVSKYTVDFLSKMKADHENWVESQLGFDPAAQRDEVFYADIVEQWEILCDTENWKAWTSWLLGGGQPQLSKEMYDKLGVLRTWLLNRVWPDRYPKLKYAFENFRRVLIDLHRTFSKHADFSSPDRVLTVKFYKALKVWDEDRYFRLVNEYENHVDLIQDLVLELTRAANLIFDRVREFIDPSYGRKSGDLLVESGPNELLEFTTYKVRYQAAERKDEFPYPGLDSFVDSRFQRDVYFGRI